MTILDQRVTEALPESCYQSKVRPPLLVEQLPSSTVASRMIDDPMFLPSLTGIEKNAHPQKHCSERKALAAKHRAEHEMTRKNVLHSVRSVLPTVDMELGSGKSHDSIVDSAKKWFDEALMGHQEMLEEMLDRQVLEAESLASMQTAELPNEHAPMLKVNFPFPEVFKQARQELISMLQ